MFFRHQRRGNLILDLIQLLLGIENKGPILLACQVCYACFISLDIDGGDPAHTFSGKMMGFKHVNQVPPYMGRRGVPVAAQAHAKDTGP